MPFKSTRSNINQIKEEAVKASGHTEDHIVIFDSEGNIIDSGRDINDYEISSAINITYSDIMTLITNSNLTPGQCYLINDFRTKHVIPNTPSNVIYTGAIETLLVIATGVNTIAARVYSPAQPLDIIEYDIFNNVCEDFTTPRTGKIVYRKDTERNLETWYDFREVTFRRYNVSNSNASWVTATAYSFGQVRMQGTSMYICTIPHTSGTFNTDLNNGRWQKILEFTTFPHSSIYDSWGYFNSSILGDVGTFTDYKTFNSSFCVNISVGYTGGDLYNNIIFRGTGTKYNIEIGNGCLDMNFEGTVENVIIGEQCSNMILSDSARRINIKQGCNSIFIDDNSFDLNIDELCLNISSVSCNNNSVGKNSANIFFASSSHQNIIGNACSTILITGVSLNNNILNECNNLRFINFCNSNLIGPGCYDNFFTLSSAYNKVLGGSIGNTFNTASYNEVESGSDSNTFNNCSYNKVIKNSNTNNITNSNNYISNSSTNTISGSTNTLLNSNNNNITGNNNYLFNSGSNILSGGGSASSNELVFSNSNTLASVGNNKLYNSNTNQLNTSSGNNTLHYCTSLIITSSSSSNKFEYFTSSNITGSSNNKVFKSDVDLTSCINNQISFVTSSSSLTGCGTCILNYCTLTVISSANECVISYGDQLTLQSISDVFLNKGTYIIMDPAASLSNSKLENSNNLNFLGGCDKITLLNSNSNNFNENTNIELKYSNTNTFGNLCSNILLDHCTNVTFPSNCQKNQFTYCNDIIVGAVMNSCEIKNQGNKTFNGSLTNVIITVEDNNVKTFTNTYDHIFVGHKDSLNIFWFQSVNTSGVFSSTAFT